MAEAALANDPWVTADQLLEFPDDGLRRELVRGEVRVTSPAGSRHGRVAMRIGMRRGAYVEAAGLGEVYAATQPMRPRRSWLSGSGRAAAW